MGTIYTYSLSQGINHCVRERNADGELDLPATFGFLPI